MDSIATVLIPIIVITIIVFLALRAFWCWYWKINKIVFLLEQQTLLLKQHLDYISDESRARLEHDISSGASGGKDVSKTLEGFLSAPGGIKGRA
jgi:hypothetical protein